MISKNSLRPTLVIYQNLLKNYTEFKQYQLDYNLLLQQELKSVLNSNGRNECYINSGIYWMHANVYR